METTERGWRVGHGAAISHCKVLVAGLLTAALGAALLVGGLAWAGPVQAPSPPNASQDMAELESMFWQCDYAATQSALDVGSAQACVVVHDALRQRKFNGDFTQLLAWWHQHKAAAHLAQAKASQQPETNLAAAGRR